MLVTPFYSRWLAVRNENLLKPHLRYLNDLDPAKPDIMRGFLMVEELNKILTDDEKLKDDFVTFFNRNEIVPDEAITRLKSTLKQITAYEYDYVESEVIDQDDVYRRWCLMDTKLLLENAVDLFFYLHKEKIVPEVALFKRRITAEDGSTLLDWLSEDDELCSWRFNFFVQFYKQVECFFFFHRDENSPPPVILPVDFRVREANLL